MCPHRRSIPRLLPALLIGVVFFAAPAPALAAPTFEISFSTKLRSDPFTGRVILFLSTDTSGEPRSNHSWLSREPIFAQDIKALPPDTSLALRNLDGFPVAPADLPPGKYAVQAVLHTNPDVPHSGTAPGNLYSKKKIIEFAAGQSPSISLKITRRVKARPRELHAENIKSIRLRSNCLSKFHQRDIFLRAAVMLPGTYDQDPANKFPVLYAIPGFGGDEFEALQYVAMLGGPPKGFVCVGLDATCPLGHHVFTDSDNNGPCGRALIEELIPHLEKEFRLISEPSARYLAGHSSGGWSSLWLQIAYPDYFGGVWSTSPDPVDFHDFSGINLYDPRANFYSDAADQKRPIMRRGGKILMQMEDFARMGDVIGPGGQMASFEAAFSPRGKDGLPMPLWNRQTGAIDPKVAEAWRRYDIVDKIKREWSRIGPKLKGKITVITGEEDNFYLAGAVHFLKKAVSDLNSDARIIIEPGKDHGSILFTPSARKITKEMSERFRKTRSKPRSTPDAE